MFGNYSAEAGVIAQSSEIINAEIRWNFNDVLVLNFDPLENFNDRPRINFWRSDSSLRDFRYLQFISGGKDVLYPAPTGKIIQQWGDRRTGIWKLDIPVSPPNIFAGVDVFTHTWAKPSFLYPPFESGWTSGSDPLVPHEIKYQYQFGNNKPSNIIVEIDADPLCAPVTLPPCSLPEEYIAYKGVNQVGCPIFDCVYLTQVTSSSSSTPPVEINCTNLGDIVLSGFAFYRHNFNNRDCIIPNVGTLQAPCWDGHVCDRTNFLPKLIFSDGRILTGNKEISLNNLGAPPYDRNDTFEFFIPNSIPLTGQQINLNLECKSPNNNCHIGVTYVVMTLTTGTNQTTIVFNNCVAPGQLTNVPIVCQSGTFSSSSSSSFSSSSSSFSSSSSSSSSSSNSSSSSLYVTGRVEHGGLYPNDTWIAGAGAANIGNWFFMSGSGTSRYIENTTLNGRSGIGPSGFFFGPSLITGSSYIDAYFKLKNKLPINEKLSIDSNYFYNAGYRSIEFMTGIFNDAVFRIEQGFSNILFLRTGSTFSAITNSNVYTKAVTTEVSAMLSGNSGSYVQTGTLIQLKETNQNNYFFTRILPITNPIEQLHIYVGDVKVNNALEQQQYGLFVNNISIDRLGSGIALQSLNFSSTPEIATLVNTGQKSINISNWRLVSHDGTIPPLCPALPATQTFTFANGTVLNPGGTIQILSDYPAATPPTPGPNQVLWTASSIWNNDGDVLSLYNSNNELVLTERYGVCTGIANSDTTTPIIDSNQVFNVWRTSNISTSEILYGSNFNENTVFSIISQVGTTLNYNFSNINANTNSVSLLVSSPVTNNGGGTGSATIRATNIVNGTFSERTIPITYLSRNSVACPTPVDTSSTPPVSISNGSIITVSATNGFNYFDSQVRIEDISINDGVALITNKRRISASQMQGVINSSLTGQVHNVGISIQCRNTISPNTVQNIGNSAGLKVIIT